MRRTSGEMTSPSLAASTVGMIARVAALGLAAVLVVAMPAGALPAETPPAPQVEDLTPLGETVDFPVGVAIDSRETTGAASELLLRHFNQITPENAMKPEAWYDASQQFSPSSEIASLMDFAAANDLRVYGHVLVWHSQIPAWFFQNADGTPLTDSVEDRRILTDRLRTHIFSVAEYLGENWGPFGGGNPVIAFDVVNEVIADDASFDDGLRRNAWYRVLGEDYIDLAFRYADEAFNGTYAAPEAGRPVTLFINDYNTERADKRGRYLVLVDRLLERGIPIDGIGHQFHVSSGTETGDFARALDDASGRGLTQAVTELDVPTGTPVTDANLFKQGVYLRDAFRVFRDRADQLFSVTLWGLYDTRSWRHPEGAPLLFDLNLQAKPAYYGVVEGYADERALEDFRAVDPFDPAPWIVGGGGTLALGLWLWWRRMRAAFSRRVPPVADIDAGAAVDTLTRELPPRR